jgi:N-acetylglucosaminyldiphosphoundecaprenol N-acetyl-beta-D-mannosaminyltransferase
MKMTRLFNVNFEFNKTIVNEKITQNLKTQSKGYVCVVDGNVLSNANTYTSYNNIINNSLLNICDGSSIALLGNLIYKKKYGTYVGAEIFADFTASDYKQYFLGNTDDVLDKLKIKFKSQGFNTNSMVFNSLPFKDVNDFDYESIAKEINITSCDIVWVSLGAPKQEIFMSKLLPHLNKGVLFGVGAAFNFCLNEDQYKRAPKLLRSLKLEWAYRVINEPKRIGGRAFSYAMLLPKLIFKEIKNNN